ncbi:MAG: ATP-binding protein [Bdellovibrionales bacterium]
MPADPLSLDHLDVLIVDPEPSSVNQLAKTFKNSFANNTTVNFEASVQRAKRSLSKNKRQLVVINLDTIDSSKEKNEIEYFFNTAPTLLITSTENSNDLEGLDMSYKMMNCINRSHLSQNTIQRAVYSSQYRFRMDSENSLLAEYVNKSHRLSTLGLLTSGIVHDINNKLAAITSSIILAEKALHHDKPYEQHFKRVKSTILSAGKICMKALAFGKPIEITPVEVNLGDAVYNCFELIEGSLNDKVSIDFANHNHSWKTKVDLVHLDQIFTNFVYNASHAFSAEGFILVKVDEVTIEEEVAVKTGLLTPGEYIKCSIIDNGGGINRDFLDKIFKPFFTTKSSESGHGLGLSIALNLIHKNEAHLDLHSNEGEGSEFSVYFKRTS